MENKKQEVIRLAYGEWWESLSAYVTVDGWVETDKNSLYIRNSFYLDGSIETTEMYDAKYWRPKSLQGIENNNGWISIESEEDLPKLSYGNYHVFTKEPIYVNGKKQNIEEYWQEDLNKKNWWMENVTHYQPIQKPKPPIY